MPKKVLIVGAALVAAIVVFFIFRRKASAAGVPYSAGTSPISPVSAIATLQATPPRELAGAVVSYAAGQVGAGIQAAIPQNTAKPVGTTYTGGQACADGAYVDPETGKCGSNRFASIAAAASKALNYNPSVGYYG